LAAGAAPAADWAAVAADLAARGEPVRGLRVTEVDAGGPFPVLLAVPRGEPKGAVVVMLDRGAHPDGPWLGGPLRRALAEAGWAVAVVPPPWADPATRVPAAGPAGTVAGARIAAAANRLPVPEADPFYVVGQGWGAAAASAWLAGRDEPPAQGLVAVEPTVPGPPGAALSWRQGLGEMAVPALLVRFAARGDAPAPLPPAAGGVRELVLAGPAPRRDAAGHVVKRIRSWLERRAREDAGGAQAAP
jgi:hypothetical protein